MSSQVDPAISQLRIPKEAISELESLVNTPPPKPAEHSVFSAPKVRFYTSLLSLITFGVFNLICNSIIQIQWASLFAAVLIFEWSNLYANALSHRRHAFFDVKNVLETYQPRARTHGHLFQPEPDTPRPECCPAPQNDQIVGGSPMHTVGESLIAEMTNANVHSSQFDKNVHDHYAGMYDNIKRVQSEMELLDKANKANENMGFTHSDAAKAGELVPADIPIPGATKNSKKQNKSD